MHKVYFDSQSFWRDELCSKRVSSKSPRAINRYKSEVGRNSLRYRGPLLWNYVNKMIDVSSTLRVFKASIRN